MVKQPEKVAGKENEAVIPARKSPALLWLLERLYLKPALRRHFHSIWLSVHPEAQQTLVRTPAGKRPPVVFTAPHPSWWDGHLAWFVARAFGPRDGYMMMDVLSLRNYRFFAWGGAFSVDRFDARAALASIDYICEILRSGPNKGLWIFPQGTITPPDRRPIRFYPGVAHVVRKLDVCDVVPLAWRIVYRLEQHPEVYCLVGPPLRFQGPKMPVSREITGRLEQAIQALDDELSAVLAATEPKDIPPGFKPLLQGRGSVSRRWDAALLRLRRLIRRG